MIFKGFSCKKSLFRTSQWLRSEVEIISNVPYSQLWSTRSAKPARQLQRSMRVENSAKLEEKH
jgi:hypothetical protein